MIFWILSVGAVATRLFRESFQRLLVQWFAWEHVIVGGLGDNGSRLVETLRAKRKTVIVIEPRADHPSLDLCRRLGAIILTGEPDEKSVLLSAKLPLASALCALFGDERACVRIATTAYDILKDEKRKPKKPPVCCVLRLTEPGLLDVVRRHKIKTDVTDRIQLEILNAHEIAATTMVREAVANSLTGVVNKVIVLGLGAHHRLGEMVVLRAIRDHCLSVDRTPDQKLDLHIYDDDATAWVDSFRKRHPELADYHELTAYKNRADKVGAADFTPPFDAAFVCMADEAGATAQAVMLRSHVLKNGEPIMVRVLHSGSGYGELIRQPDSGWGENIQAVGLEDSLFDPDTATGPEMEMRAQTIHHEYRRLQRRAYHNAKTEEEREKILRIKANVPWIRLEDNDRTQNRDVAVQYDKYLKMIIPGKKDHRYRSVFMPNTSSNHHASGISEAELDALAEVDHNRWLAMKRDQGFTYGHDRSQKQNPFLLEWTELTEDQRRFNSELARTMPRTLALADYAIVRESPGTPNSIEIPPTA